jgi:hypothetical protein
LAKQQAVTQVNLEVASLNKSEDADLVDRWGRPQQMGKENGIFLSDLPG